MPHPFGGLLICQDSNLEPAALETAALPVELQTIGPHRARSAVRRGLAARAGATLSSAQRVTDADTHEPPVVSLRDGVAAPSV